MGKQTECGLLGVEADKDCRDVRKGNGTCDYCVRVGQAGYGTRELMQRIIAENTFVEGREGELGGVVNTVSSALLACVIN